VVTMGAFSGVSTRIPGIKKPQLVKDAVLIWWALTDSNCGPDDYESRALQAKWVLTPRKLRSFWWASVSAAENRTMAELRGVGRHLRRVSSPCAARDAVRRTPSGNRTCWRVEQALFLDPTHFQQCISQFWVHHEFEVPIHRIFIGSVARGECHPPHIGAVFTLLRCVA